MSGFHTHSHGDGHGHRHGHGHLHLHGQALVAEPVQVPAPDSPPVLDIGGEVGALVVYLAAQTPSGELEACPVDEPAARFHTGVHERSMGFGSGLAWTAVFPEVVEGSYHLLAPDGSSLARVTVAGGTVHQLDLR
jgi:hypothetical protein